MIIKDLGEFGLIDRIKSTVSAPSKVTGIGDDCAIIPQKKGFDTLVSCDMLVEGVHFLKNDIPPYRLGWKSAAVNISDIAAMGGKPFGTFLSVSLPGDLEVNWMDEFMNGFNDCSNRYGVVLLGGDTTSSKNGICINVTVLGNCASGTSKLRSDAKVGDLICVTGNLGDSAGGLKVILQNAERSESGLKLIERHYMPMPRVTEGLSLSRESGVHAMMDISDGIASDIRHILKASGVSAEIDIDKIPISSELRAVWPQEAVRLAVSGGEDYELLFSVSQECEKGLEIPHSVIGKIIERSDKLILWRGSEEEFHGFEHF